MSDNEIVWRKARASGGSGGQCVEVGRSAADTNVRLRDSKRREAGHLKVTADSFAALLADAKSRRLDL